MGKSTGGSLSDERGVLIEPASHASVVDVGLFACQEFSQSSVLHQAVGVSVLTYTDYALADFISMAEGKLSFVARETCTGQLLGCLLAKPLSHRKVTGSAGSSRTPSCLRPVSSLLDDLEAQYLRIASISGPCAAQSAVLVDVAVVSAQARKRGVYTQLRHAVHQRAKELGYRYVVGQLSSEATQALCTIRLRHEVVSEIAYETYLFEGGFPFADIKRPRTIQMVQHDLLGSG